MPELCSLPAPRKSRGHRSPWKQADLPPTLNQPRCRTTRDHPTARSPPKSLKLSGPALARLACPAAHPSHEAAAEAAAGTVPHRLCLADRPRRFPTRPREVHVPLLLFFQTVVSAFVNLPHLISPGAALSTAQTASFPGWAQGEGAQLRAPIGAPARGTSELFLKDGGCQPCRDLGQEPPGHGD